MSRVLVTGGAGFIGGHLVERLVATGREVRVLDDLSTGFRRNLSAVENDVEFIEGTICDPQTLARCCAGVEVVFHLAAQGSVPRSVEEPRTAHEINATGTLNVLAAARDAGVRRVVYSASSAAYGDTPTLPKVETFPPQPLSPYAVSKLAGEYYCSCFSAVYGLSTISLRYFNVFGPRQDPNSQYAAAIPAFVTRLVRGQPPIVYGDGEQSRDFCFIENVVHANLLAAEVEHAAGEVVNIACGEHITLNRMIALMREHLGVDIEPQYEAPRPGDVRHSLADISAARRLLGYEPQVMFAEGLRRSIDWYRENYAT